MEGRHTSTLVWLDPRSIRDWFGVSGPWAKLRDVPCRVGLPDHIRRGGWDRRVSPLEDHPTFRLMRAFEECGYEVARLRDRLGDSYPRRNGKPALSLEGREFVRYVEYYRKIALSMRRDGYLPAAPGHHLRIALARDGRPVKISGGNHRLALARLVGLSAVQAEVRFVHRAWLRAAGRPDPRAIRGSLEQAGFAVCRDDIRAFGLPQAMPRP